jgi:2-oxoglutarate dehydrogenase complex dehydrogenase (E1) component-like enzyme
MHIPSKVQCDWIRSHIEGAVKYSYGKEQKRVILDRLLWADSFERFVASKYASEKRFGLEGCESLIPGMKALVRSLLSFFIFFLFYFFCVVDFSFFFGFYFEILD